MEFWYGFVVRKRQLDGPWGNLYGMKMEKWQVCDSGSYEGMDVQDPVSNWGYCDSWDAPVVNLTQN